MVAPITTASISAVLIDCCSNIIAQSLSCWNDSEPWHISLPELTRFLIFAALTAPPNFLWQSFLERSFPKWIVEPLPHTESIALEETHHQRPGRAREGDKARGRTAYEASDAEPAPGEGYVRRRNKRNIALKWFTDCITMGALLNTTAFLAIMGVLKGRGLVEIGRSMREEMFPIIWNSYKIWPFASVINFTFIPVEKRIVFLSFCGLLWNIYLSVVAARV